jgi:hypothetical protein
VQLRADIEEAQLRVVAAPVAVIAHMEGLIHIPKEWTRD